MTSNAAVLREAEQVSRTELEVLTRDRRPMDWARTQGGLGNVLGSLGALTGDAAVLRQAEEAHRAALLEYVHDRAPIEWATAQNNIGLVLKVLNFITGDATVARRAEQALRDALLAFDDAGAEDLRQGTAATLARLLGALGRHDQAMAVIVPALGRSDAALLEHFQSD